MERKKLETYMSPKATAKWAVLNKPDTKFKPEGEYRVTLVIPEADAQGFIEQLDKLHAAAVAEVKAQLLADPKKRLKAKTMKTENMPYSKDLDGEGEETGLVKFNFKAKASGKRKDLTEWTFKPRVFDAKGKPLAAGIQVWGGSVVKVAFQAKPYFVEASGQTGLTLSLQAVQVIELKTSGGADASAFGFTEEEGYVGEEAVATTGDVVDGDAPASGSDF